MSANRQPPVEPADFAELAEMTAEELIRRGEAMTKLGRELLMQAGAVGAITDLPQARSVGRFGVITEADAIRAAGELQTFTRLQFAEKLGLSVAACNRWLSKLTQHKPPIAARQPDGNYRYIPPPSSTRERERHTPAEVAAIDRSATPERGRAVRVPRTKRDARELSKPGSGHRVRLTDRQYERDEAKRAERAARKQRNGNGNK